MMRILGILPFVAIGCSSEAKIPPPANRQVDFTADVQPIFTRHCIGCHGPKKQNGSYRLDVKETALKAEVVKVGDSANSAIIHHVLGIHDRKRMPPEAPHLTDDQVGILRAWIDQGAAWLEPPTKKD
jgi:mono/diheme cytochrome c family protein